MMRDTQLQRQVQDQMNNDLLFGQMMSSVSEMERQLSNMCSSENLVMTGDLKRLVMAGGKRLRPSLAYICHHMGDENQLEILPLMCMLELMHTSSLIHDDVVDDADLRRNVETIHHSSGRVAAVQSGDFLLGRAMEKLHVYRGTGINELLADISTQMCLGEFQQMNCLFDPKGQTIEKYYEQIRRKTAYLLAASCKAGGIAGGLPEEQTEALYKYGEYIGIAFQLKDDILDYTGTQEFGKEKGQDLLRGIFTLPAIYAFTHSPEKDMLQLAAKPEKHPQELDDLLDYVTRSNGIDYTEEKIQEFSRKAIEALDPIKDCEERDALVQMARILGDRTK